MESVDCDVFSYFCFLSLFLNRQSFNHETSKVKKKINPWNIQEEKFWSHEISKGSKMFRPTNYPWEKYLDPRNTQDRRF